MPVKPFGEYRPDVSDYEGQHTRNILNVVPKGDGYGPFNSHSNFTAPLPNPCRGYFYARKSDGTIQVFAGDIGNLYTMNNATLDWSTISGSTAYQALVSNANWQFAQFNNLVLAVHQNVVPQVYSLTTSTAFSNLAGSPPQAAYISVVNRFLVLSGLLTPDVYRVQWSGLNDLTEWDPGENLSDFQDLPDGGIVRGVAGGEYGIIFQDTSIRRMSFQPGSAFVFGIDRISQDDGLYAAGSLIAAGDKIFYLSPGGFKMIAPGGYPTPIGKERVDRTFFADHDANNLQLIIGAHDPKNTRVYWAYKSNNSAPIRFDTILVYDWALDKWSKIESSGEYITSLARPGLTLEDLDESFGFTVNSTVTISSANPGVVTWTAHGMAPGTIVRFTTTGTLPPSFVASTDYYVLPTGLTADTFQISLTDGGAALTGVGSQFGVHTAYHANIETLPVGSLDDIATSAIAALSLFDDDHQLGFFSGPTLEATLETAEQGGDGRRVYLNGLRPVTDAGVVFGSVSKRDTAASVTSYSTETALNLETGECPAHVDTRYARGKIRIPSGASWTYAAGVEPVGTTLTGKR